MFVLWRIWNSIYIFLVNWYPFLFSRRMLFSSNSYFLYITDWKRWVHLKLSRHRSQLHGAPTYILHRWGVCREPENFIDGPWRHCVLARVTGLWWDGILQLLGEWYSRSDNDVATNHLVAVHWVLFLGDILWFLFLFRLKGWLLLRLKRCTRPERKMKRSTEPYVLRWLLAIYLHLLVKLLRLILL